MDSQKRKSDKQLKRKFPWRKTESQVNLKGTKNFNQILTSDPIKNENYHKAKKEKIDVTVIPPPPHAKNV